MCTLRLVASDKAQHRDAGPCITKSPSAGGWAGGWSGWVGGWPGRAGTPKGPLPVSWRATPVGCTLGCVHIPPKGLETASRQLAMLPAFSSRCSCHHRSLVALCRASSSDLSTTGGHGARRSLCAPAASVPYNRPPCFSTATGVGEGSAAPTQPTHADNQVLRRAAAVHAVAAAYHGRTTAATCAALPDLEHAHEVGGRLQRGCRYKARLAHTVRRLPLRSTLQCG